MAAEIFNKIVSSFEIIQRPPPLFFFYLVFPFFFFHLNSHGLVPRSLSAKTSLQINHGTRESISI